MGMYHSTSGMAGSYYDTQLDDVNPASNFNRRVYQAASDEDTLAVVRRNFGPNPYTWTIEGVGAWLCAIELPIYQPAFKNNSVNGEILFDILELDKEHEGACQDGPLGQVFEKIGVQLFHRKFLLRQIRKLRDHQEGRAWARSMDTAFQQLKQEMTLAEGETGSAPSNPAPSASPACPIDIETLKKMVTRENELRTCPETQDKMHEAEGRGETDWMQVAQGVQEQVAREFGYGHMVDEAVHILRTARNWYPDEPFFKEVPLYVKYNRARNGPLHEGSLAPDVPLMDLDGNETSLMSHGGVAEPLVVIGGSYS